MIGLDKFRHIKTRMAPNEVSLEQIRPSPYAIVKVLVNRFAETVKHSIADHWTVVPIIVANRRDRIQARNLTRIESRRDFVLLELFKLLESFGPKLNNSTLQFQFCGHMFPLESRRYRIGFNECSAYRQPLNNAVLV